MTDPFSIASGAVGIISLGIQLCKQITDYVEAWRGYDEDIENIGLKAESLKGPLKQLRDFVEDTHVTDLSTANDLDEKASQLGWHLKRLEKRLAQAKPVISDSLKEKLRNKLKKVAYPVRVQDSLKAIKNDLDSVQATIQLALAIFNAQQAQKTHHFQKSTLKLVQDIHLTISTLSRNNMPAPGLLKSLCDRCDKCTDLTNQKFKLSNAAQSDNFDLDIEARLSAMPFTKHTRREGLTKTLFQYYSGWLRRQITLSFLLSDGAGAYSIAPVLEVQVYQGEDCWVENAVSSRRFLSIQMIKDPDLLQDAENELIVDFQQAISLGKFGPRDITKHGRPVVEWIFLNVTENLKYNYNDDLSFSNFMRFMIRCGYRPERSTFSLPIMFTVMNAKWRADGSSYMFALYLMNHGAAVNFLPWTLYGKVNFRCLLRRHPDLVDLPEIARIILLELELELREKLQSGGTEANERISCLLSEKTLLELAVGWPDGVRTLLDFGADPSQVKLRNTYRTWDKACSDCDDYHDSIVPLLQGGCSFTSSDIQSCRQTKTRLLLIDEHANRCKRLYSMARSCLPPGCLAEILGDASEESTLATIDVHAPQVCTELINNGMPVHRSLHPDSRICRPLYHAIYNHLEDWEYVQAWNDLYRAGFRDIDLPNSFGVTPLISHALEHEPKREALVWLIDKGATLSRRLPSSNTTIAHLLSSRFPEGLENAIHFGMSSSRSRLYESLEWARKYQGTIVLIPSVTDSCICACCHGGCTTLLVALRRCNAALKNYYSPCNPLSGAEYSWLLNSLIDLTETTRERDHSIIRFLTFEALLLRHTCCTEISDGSWPSINQSRIMDPEEVQNIQNEDQHRYKQLNQLVEKFNPWFDELELPIMEFLNGPWHSHMAKYLSTRDSYDEEHMLKTRDLGVFLEPAEFDEIPTFFYLLGSQVEELEREDAVSDDEDSDEDDEFDDEAKNGTSGSSA